MIRKKKKKWKAVLSNLGVDFPPPFPGCGVPPLKKWVEQPLFLRPPPPQESFFNKKKKKFFKSPPPPAFRPHRRFLFFFVPVVFTRTETGKYLGFYPRGAPNPRPPPGVSLQKHPPRKRFMFFLPFFFSRQWPPLGGGAKPLFFLLLGPPFFSSGVKCPLDPNGIFFFFFWGGGGGGGKSLIPLERAPKSHPEDWENLTEKKNPSFGGQRSVGFPVGGFFFFCVFVLFLENQEAPPDPPSRLKGWGENGLPLNFIIICEKCPPLGPFFFFLGTSPLEIWYHLFAPPPPPGPITTGKQFAF